MNARFLDSVNRHY